MNIEDFRRDLESFSSEMSLEYYLNWSGQKDELNLSGIYGKYPGLFERKNVAEIKDLRAIEKEGEDGERRLCYLQAFVTEELLGHHVKDLTDESETIQTSASIKPDGEDIPYRLAQVRYTNEDNRVKRSKIFQARNKLIEAKLNPILERRVEKLHRLAKELGYPNYIELYRETKQINFEQLAESMNYFVRRTESLFSDKMGEAIRKVSGVELTKAEKHDAAYLFRAKDFDTYFKKENALPVLKKTLMGIGYNIDEKRNVSIDIEERPKKSPRAFTSTVKVPNDVRLVIMPSGGQDDYAAILHEAGHTAHYSSVDRGLAVEYKLLGDASVTETYAFLFEYLTLNQDWLKENVGIKDFGKYLDFAYLYKLYFLRRYAGKLNYELLLHKAKKVTTMNKVYKRKLEESLKFIHPEAHYLTDVDDGFYTAQYLKGWIFEAQLKAKMAEKFGKIWFKSKDAGKFLAELWASGQKYSADELAQRIGYKGLDVEPILTEINEHFA